MKCPAEVYQSSTRTYKGLPDIDYPFHDKIIVKHTVLPAKRSASKKFTMTSM
jgi:hypothetical protein